LVKEVLKPFAIVLCVLAAMYGSYCLASVLSDAASGLLPLGDIAAVVGLRVLISLEVLVPISLYLSVLVSLSQMSSQSEVTAMLALAVSPTQISTRILLVVSLLAVCVAALSLVVRPIAYLKIHEISARADASINFNSMSAGTFFEDRSGKWVIYIGKRDSPDAPARDVLIRVRRDDYDEVISAKQMLESADQPDRSRTTLDLRDVSVYRESNGPDDRRAELAAASRMILGLTTRKPHSLGYSSVAAPSSVLMRSKDATDRAEFQWRLSTPLSTLLLAGIAIPLSRTKPRQGSYANFGIAIGIYASYYLACAAARIWVQQGKVPAVPGIWWVPALLAMVTAALVFRRRPNVLS
jgi:lipopolysaccharide export system permease protein